MNQLILVGGPTLVGKSNFVDILVDDGIRFVRPRSYTTRLRRLEETRSEYEHVSIIEFNQLKTNGAFITVDEVYGNSYAISYESIVEIVKTQRVAIKEVHPKNHKKIKELLSGVISVLLLPKDMKSFWIEAERDAYKLPKERVERLYEDKRFYEDLDFLSYPFDIVLRIDLNSDLELLKKEFIYLLQNQTINQPNLKDIERKNRSGYEFIASEFTDEKRVTTANFHDLSFEFLLSETNRQLGPKDNVLDLGTGRGYLAHKLSETYSKVFSVDLAFQMLQFNGVLTSQVKMVCGSAFNLPFLSDSFNVVVSSLADPFLIEAALVEISRVLKKDGRFICSSPSEVWSAAFRDHVNNSRLSTKFLHSSGLEVEVFSFTYTNDQLVQLLLSCGFIVEIIKTVSGKELKKHSRDISPALLNASRKLKIELDDLPIVQLLIARKG